MRLDEALAILDRRIDTATRIGVKDDAGLNVTFGALRAVVNGIREARSAMQRQAAAVRMLADSRSAQDEIYRRIAMSVAGVDRAALLALLAATREECRRWNARATDLEEEVARAHAAAAAAGQLSDLRGDFVAGRQVGMEARHALGEALVEEPDEVPPAPPGASDQWRRGWRRGWQEMAVACERDHYRAELAKRVDGS